MKIILLSDVKKVGRKHETKNVPSGFARNFLLPKKLALISDKSTEKFIARVQEDEEKQKKEREMNLEKMLGDIAGKEIHFKVKADRSGSLFAGIGDDEIALQLKEELGITVHVENIHLDAPLKKVGEAKIAIGTKDKRSEIKVSIEKL